MNPKKKPGRSFDGKDLSGLVQGCKSLTMTYFHTGIRTIIGAKSFHGPVRDGKEWGQLAMVVKHNGVMCCSLEQHIEFIEPISLVYLDYDTPAKRLGVGCCIKFFDCISLGITHP